MPNEVPTRLEYLKNLKGIEETKDVLEFLAKIGQAVNVSLMDDNAITLKDTFNFTSALIALPDAIQGIKDVPVELTDELTEEELATLQTVIESAGVLPERALQATKEGLAIAESLKMWIINYLVRE